MSEFNPTLELARRAIIAARKRLDDAFKEHAEALGHYQALVAEFQKDFPNAVIPTK